MSDYDVSKIVPKRFPAGVLRNTATGRFHPIVFYASPKPSEAGESIVRHRSKQHHTAGVATMNAAGLRGALISSATSSSAMDSISSSVSLAWSIAR